MSMKKLPVALNNVLVKLKIKKATSVKKKKHSLEWLHRQAELLYFDVMPSAWNVKDTEYPFQCYSIRAAKMCIDLIEGYGNYSFLEDIDDACRRWMRSRQRNISIGYKFQNPYSAFLVFLVELCVRLKKLQRKWKRVQCTNPPERKFQRLLLTCLGSCFEMALLKNKNQVDSAVKILRKVATDALLDTKMDAVISFMDTHEMFEVNDQVATFFRIQIRAMMNNLELIDKVATKSKK